MCVVVLFCSAPGRSPAAPAGGLPFPGTVPPAAAARAEVLADALTFRLSFDRETMMPDMAAAARHEPSLNMPPGPRGARHQFRPGLAGHALVLGTGSASYPNAGNLTLDSCGAIALWVKPVNWRRPNGANVTFVIAAGGRFYLQRQGPMRGDDGKVRRHEHIQYLAKADAQQRHFTSLSGGVWKNGRWHFLVANWRWPVMELSIDGAPFTVASLPRDPETMVTGRFAVGALGGDESLLDEVLMFRRPLSLDEVRLLHEAGLSAAGANASGGTDTER
jgi:hypothetical protein